MNTVPRQETSPHAPEEPLRQRMRQFYETSERYKGLLAEHDEAYHKPFVELVNRYAPPHSRVLELGCGNGIASRLLNRSGHHVIGTDISALFLGEAEKWQQTVTHDGEHNLEYRVCDVLELPFQDEMFDVVCSNELIEHVPDAGAALSEMIRVTRKGGRIIICGPNLCSPLMPLIDLLRLIRGKPGRPFWGETKRQAFSNSVRNFHLYLKKRLSSKPQFLYREPELGGQVFGGDGDSAYYANPIDLEKYFRHHGLRIVRRCVGFSAKGKLMSICFPRVSLYISMVVKR
ncbi:MAG: class I SAM-dependent methyltransferase [Candidatus Poribacteria bacterium]|nr:class I SAM-dependent methyltransferase [Candidatus Poribacteria bacterium]MDE0505654.1 class I SAM-dependent methyltransferase [Candidatus Poribacteria bacterium]